MGDPYAPYADIPWTPVFDPMENNLRNRLQMFIGKSTQEMQDHLLHHKPKPGVKDQLADGSLIKWDNKSDEKIINKARKLIWTAYNAEKEPDKTAKDHLADFDKFYKAIKEAETKLYGITNRHLQTAEVKKAETALQKAIDVNNV